MRCFVCAVEPEPRDLIETPVVNVEPSAPPTAAGPSSAPDDEEIPEGVDPSFLEALPPEIRREVLEQHRILSRQQRLAARAAETATTSSNTEEGESFLKCFQIYFLILLDVALKRSFYFSRSRSGG